MKSGPVLKAGTVEQAKQPFRIGLALWATAAATFAAGVFWFGMPAVIDPASPDFIPFPAALALFFAGFGTLHLVQGVLAKWRFARAGESTLDAGPAVLGKVYRGRIRTAQPITVSGPYEIRLLCESRNVREDEGGSNRRTARQPV